MNDDLPSTVREVAEVLGRHDALLLAGACKNRRCYVPKLGRLQPTHWLVRLLGYDQARTLSREFGGSLIYLARCERLYNGYRNQRIREMHKAGTHVRELADIMQLSERSILYVLAEKPANENLPQKVKNVS